MAAIATEPQRLIAVSLGKIAASRSQRGGINLHKNLLVASVLHKARTAYMMENFQQMLAAKRAQAEQAQQQTTLAADTTSANSQRPACHEAPVSRSTSNTTPPRNSDSFDKENTPPRESCVEKMDTYGQEKSSSKNDSPLRNPCDSTTRVNSNENKDRDYVSKGSDNSSCVLKRRRSHASLDIDTVLAKKPKYSDNLLESETQCEPMQTEPTQISNLVSIFNTGFGGLCSRSSDNGDLQLGFTRSDSLPCSAHVEHRVDVPTGIALTV